MYEEIGLVKAKCKKFSDSISPLTIPKSNKEIRELLDCLEGDIELYNSSLEAGTDDFINHFRESVFTILQKRGRLQSFKNQMVKYVRVLEAKTVSIFHNFNSSFKKMGNDMRQIRYTRYDSEDVEAKKHFLIDSMKLVYVDFSNLLMIVSQMFFALEFYCKILCALGCVRFALKVAKNEVIQHNACRKQIKRLSDKDSTYCETCIVSDTCESKIDFEALSRIYSYSMKIRQIADYTPKFISFDIKKSGLIEPPLAYFGQLQSLLRENSLFYKCLADVIPEIPYERRKLVEELRTPFLWDNEKMLREAVKKSEGSHFYNYLLGRFYYEKNRFEEAIEPLEKAKEINPLNAHVWNMLGTIYDAEANTKRDLEKAIRCKRKARDLEPSNHDFLLELGISELAVGDYFSSVEDLFMACQCAQTDFEKCATFLVLSEAYRMKKSVRKSKHYLRKANQLSKPHADATLEWLREFIRERAKLQ